MAVKFIKKPAENNMYTCRDIHAGYGLPFSCTDDKMAEKAFQLYCLTDEDGKIRAPYLELYKCGIFNRDTGEYKNTKIKLLAKGANYVQDSVQRESQNASTSGK